MRNMRTNTSLTLGQAAKAASVAKSTISRAIGEGRLSAGQDESGAYCIEPAELFRVFPPKSDATVADGVSATAEGTESNPAGTGDGTASNALVAALREQIADWKVMADRERAIADEVRRQLEGERSERARLLDLVSSQADQMRLLTDQRQTEQAPPLPRRRKFLGLFGGGNQH